MIRRGQGLVFLLRDPAHVDLQHEGLLQMHHVRPAHRLPDHVVVRLGEGIALFADQSVKHGDRLLRKYVFRLFSVRSRLRQDAHVLSGIPEILHRSLAGSGKAVALCKRVVHHIEYFHFQISS